MNDGPYLNNNVHSDWSTILQIEIQNVIWQHDIQQRWSAQWSQSINGLWTKTIYSEIIKALI